jgi:TonB family protein
MESTREGGLSVPPHLVGAEETTVLKILINEQGATEEVVILKPSKDVGRDQEAVARARKMSFKPAQINGSSAKGWYILPIKFAD